MDTWGVDFGLLDAQGKLLEAPTHYRDERHPPAMADVHSLIPPEEIWAKTGVQFMPFNTLYQLHALQTRSPGLLDRAAHLLLMPDLFHHQLTGGRSVVNERTEASTTQLVQPGNAAVGAVAADPAGPAVALSGRARPCRNAGRRDGGRRPRLRARLPRHRLRRRRHARRSRERAGRFCRPGLGPCWASSCPRRT